MNTRTLRYAAISAALLFSPFAFGGASGQAIGFTCNGCHGTDGDSQGTAPSLQGEDAEDLREMLIEFKSGEEEGTIMGRIARGYSDEELAAVAEYYANLK